ncbi:MAG TPA: long-chain fatty acid--CoA ligase [Planctomycetes bacterium]|nr:long-chain fatty acid--CoA ligase [Planctomycetota bacterium]
MIQRLEKAAASRSDDLAISNEQEALSFFQLLRLTEDWRERLSSYPKGTRLLISLPGGPSFLAVQLAAIEAGLVFAAMPHETPPEGRGKYLELFQPDLFLGDEGLSPQTVGKRADLPAEAAMLQFTSGSTGLPKGILVSKAQLTANLEINREHIQGIHPGPVFCPIPQFHAMGNAVVLEYLLHGIPVHLSNRFVPAFELGRITEFACRSVLASPNWFQLLLKLGALSAEKLPSLSSMTLGTASVDTTLVQGLRQAFPQAHIHLRYGLSESVGALTRLDIPPGKGLESRGLVGPPVPGIRIQNLPGLEEEPGELRAKGPCTCLGQLSSPERFERLDDAEGWLSTGDLASMDAEGRVHLRGRSSSFIKSGGHRIEPGEIEAVLRSFPAVLDAVVVGVQDPLLGQKIAAGLEVQEDWDQGALRRHCRTFLPPYKIPQRIQALSPFPRTAAGKPDLSKVRQHFEGTQGQTPRR